MNQDFCLQKFTRLVVLGLVAGGLCAASIYGYPNSMDDLMLSAAMREEARIDQIFDRFRCFDAELRQTYGEVLDEDLSLAQAIEQIHISAQKHYPPFLKQLPCRNKLMSTRQAIAENILLFFQNEISATGSSDRLIQLVARLRTENAQLFALPSAVTVENQPASFGS